MVAAVMVTSGLCILLMLASFMSVTGNAIQSGFPSNQGILNMLGENTLLVEGDGRLHCDRACALEEKYVLISSFDGEFVENKEKNDGQYKCLCVSN